MKKLSCYFFVFVIAVLFAFAKNGEHKDVSMEKLKNREIFKSVQNFDLFSRAEAYKAELKRFIEVNIEFISKLKNFDDITT